MPSGWLRVARAVSRATPAFHNANRGTCSGLLCEGRSVRHSRVSLVEPAFDSDCRGTGVLLPAAGRSVRHSRTSLVERAFASGSRGTGGLLAGLPGVLLWWSARGDLPAGGARDEGGPFPSCRNQA